MPSTRPPTPARPSRRDTEPFARAVLRGELHVHYQPVVDLTSGNLVGFEALLRWRHPHRGMLLPAAFLDVAEREGLSAPIARWVTRTVCRHVAGWGRAIAPDAPPIPVAINLSAGQLAGPELVATVAQALRAISVDPRLLMFDVPEPVLIVGASSTPALEKLHALGVRLGVDQVRSGQLDCAQLARIGIDSIKIDRSVVARLGSSADASTMVRETVRFGRRHGIVVNAVGVETAQQAVALRALGVRAGQGFYFARPQSREIVDVLVHHPLCWRTVTEHVEVVLEPCATASER